MYEEILALGDRCFSCGVCCAVCPVEIIDLRRDGGGFFRPGVDRPQDCIRCGMCSDSCSALGTGVEVVQNEIKAFSGWSEDAAVRARSSSGGLAYEIARGALARGGEACLAGYDTGAGEPLHYIARSHDDLASSTGSKYLQSNSADSFRRILESRSPEKTVFGLPCQIASLRKYLRMRGREEEFLLVDFFCHGTPSWLLWRNYVHENGIAGGEVSFRDKKNGWQESYAVTARRDGREYFRSDFSAGDLFFKLYMGNFVLNKPCYKCPFRTTSSSADIRLGDMWGRKYAGERDGISAVLALTRKGKGVLENLSGVTLKPETTEEATEGQLKGELHIPGIRAKILRGLSKGRGLRYLYRRYVLTRRLRLMPGKAWRIITGKPVA